MNASRRRIARCLLTLALLPTLVVAADAPVLQQADTYTGGQMITGWLMSEKLDGVRGVWTGEKLVTRKGRTIHAPEWFTANFPSFALDGELWRRRDDFAYVQNTVLDDEPSDDWREISYNIFEVPGSDGDFPSRLHRARAWFADHPASHVRVIQQVVCNGPEHLEAFLEKVESMGGEGVMIKNPSLAFHAGPLPYVLKVKRFRDMEGTVVAHRPGQGRFSGMLGSLTLRLENGVEFNLGTGFSDADRRQPPPVGAVVTFRYQGFTRNGIPRFASFLRVRKD